MAAELGDRYAVETIHSGPAASAMGGRFLSGCDPALVVDIGGTTTDLALVEGGQVAIAEEGTTVAGFRTAVKAANVRSFGLGGDSWLTFDKQEQLCIGPTRVVPLAQLAAQHPRVRQEIRALLRQRANESVLDELEYWFIQRETPEDGMDAHVRALYALLRDGPRTVPTILKALQLQHPMQLGGYRLLEREQIGRAGLTPTDLLHAIGTFTAWDVSAAATAAEIAARACGQRVEQFTARVFEQMTDRLLAEIVQFLSGRVLAPRELISHHDLGRWFFDNSTREPHDRYLQTVFRLKMPIIGIGAPAGVFLPPVAEILNTNLVLPPHYPVANAVGAVAGSVVATREALVYARVLDVNPGGYAVQIGETHATFTRLAEAMEYARAEALRQAQVEALRAGAALPHMLLEEIPNGMDAYRLRARAVGNPRLMRQPSG
jgi:N-methylhydantoinase A/oxoprolinase/acetone carboxylase beta subunit